MTAQLSSSRTPLNDEVADLRRQIAERRRAASEIGRSIQALGAALRTSRWEVEFRGDRIICKSAGGRAARSPAVLDVALMRTIVADLHALESRLAQLEQMCA